MLTRKCTNTWFKAQNLGITRPHRFIWRGREWRREVFKSISDLLTLTDRSRTQHIAILLVSPSVCLSVCHVPVSYRSSLDIILSSVGLLRKFEWLRYHFFAKFRRGHTVRVRWIQMRCIKFAILCRRSQHQRFHRCLFFGEKHPWNLCQRPRIAAKRPPLPVSKTFPRAWLTFSLWLWLWLRRGRPWTRHS